jgi:hypothetical protein
MLAPHFSGLFAQQSDFGHPAGVVLLVLSFWCGLGDTIVADFPPKSDLWRGSRHRLAAGCLAS